MDTTLILAVFLSTGAGYLLGKHIERQKARAAFAQTAMNTIRTIGAVVGAAVDEVTKKVPDIDVPVFVSAILAKCKGTGVEMQVVSKEQAKAMGVDVDGNKTE